MAAQEEGIPTAPAQPESKGCQDIGSYKSELMRLQDQMESLRSLNKKLVAQVTILRHSNSPRSADRGESSSPSVVSLDGSFESIDGEATADLAIDCCEDNRTWKLKLMDFLSQVEALAHQGCATLDKVKDIDARIKEVLPDNTPTRKELRQRKGLKVQELLATLCDIQLDIDVMKVSLNDDCEGLIKFVRADLVGVVNALRKLTDESSEAKELAQKKLVELEGQLEQVECERNDALCSATEIRTHLSSKIDELEQELSRLKEELQGCRASQDEASNERDALQARLEATAFLEQERDMAQVELLELREANEQLELKLCTKEGETSQAEACELEQKVAELERTKEALLAEREEMDAEAADMRERVHQMEATVRGLDADSKNMETKFLSISASNGQLVMDIESQRKQLEEACMQSLTKAGSVSENAKEDGSIVSGDDPEIKSTCRNDEQEEDVGLKIERELGPGSASDCVEVEALREKVAELEREVKKRVEVSLARDEYREKLVAMMSDMEVEIETLREELNKEKKDEVARAKAIEQECWLAEVNSLHQDLRQLIDEKGKVVREKEEAISNAQKEISVLTENLEHCRAANGRLKDDNRRQLEKIELLEGQVAEMNRKFASLREENERIDGGGGSSSSSSTPAHASQTTSWKGLLEEVWASRNQLHQAKLALNSALETKGTLEMKVQSLEARLVNEKSSAPTQEEEGAVAYSDSGDLVLVEKNAQTTSRGLNTVAAVAKSIASASVSLGGADQRGLERFDVGEDEVTSDAPKKKKWRVFATTFGISGLVAARLMWGRALR